MRPLLSIALLAVAALSGCVESGSGPTAGGLMGVRPAEPQSQSSYTCPTCGGRYAQAGNCPKCGLELVPKNDPAPNNPGNFK